MIGYSHHDNSAVAPSPSWLKAPLALLDQAQPVRPRGRRVLPSSYSQPSVVNLNNHLNQPHYRRMPTPAPYRNRQQRRVLPPIAGAAWKRGWGSSNTSLPTLSSTLGFFA